MIAKAPKPHSSGATPDLSANGGRAAQFVNNLGNRFGHMKTLHYGTRAGKRHVSQWNAVLCNRSAMEGDWTTADTTWKRLRWARAQTNYATPTDFARACRVDVPKYLAMEGGPERSRIRKLDPDTAMKVAAKTGLRWEWLLTREGKPWRESDDTSAAVREALQGRLAEEQVEELARLADLFSRTGTEG